MARFDRYRLYFRLMDIALLLTLAGIVQLVIEPAALRPEFVPGPAHLAVGIGSVLLTTFLMFAGFMRDEYAQACWEQAAATTIKGLVIIPFVTLFVSGIIAGFNAEPGVAPGPSPLEAVNGAVIFAWGWSLLLTLFVLAFQWHRWRGR
ncbi:MAG: hypothetical protein K2X31_10500 [Sphingopyxis sp.]|nr:hypothetical protein [Sphingopyxis sp.]